MKTYTYYIEFKTRCAETITIEARGVDNWTWYDEALTEYNEDDLDDDTLTNEYKDA